MKLIQKLEGREIDHILNAHSKQKRELEVRPRHKTSKPIPSDILLVAKAPFLRESPTFHNLPQKCYHLGTK